MDNTSNLSNHIDCDMVSMFCLQVVEDLVKKYKTVGGLLRKIEEVVTGTNNGKAPQLAGYYAYWERSIFSALNNMVLNAMRMLVTMLHARSAKKAAAAGLPARPPLFKVGQQHPCATALPILIMLIVSTWLMLGAREHCGLLMTLCCSDHEFRCISGIEESKRRHACWALG